MYFEVSISVALMTDRCDRRFFVKKKFLLLKTNEKGEHFGFFRDTIWTRWGLPG